MERALIYFFILKSHERCKNYVQKEKLQSRERKVYARQTSLSAIFVFNKITVPIFQKIHIPNKNLGPCVNGGLEWTPQVQILFQGLFTFLH